LAVDTLLARMPSDVIDDTSEPTCIEDVETSDREVHRNEVALSCRLLDETHTVDSELLLPMRDLADVRQAP
jgi:hypothetical protein